MDLSQLPAGVNPYVGLLFILLCAAAPSIISRVGKPRRKAEKERVAEKAVDETSKRYEDLFEENAEQMKRVLLQLSQVNEARSQIEKERAQLARENADLRRELRERDHDDK